MKKSVKIELAEHLLNKINDGVINNTNKGDWCSHCFNGGKEFLMGLDCDSVAELRIVCNKLISIEKLENLNYDFENMNLESILRKSGLEERGLSVLDVVENSKLPCIKIYKYHAELDESLDGDEWYYEIGFNSGNRIIANESKGFVKNEYNLWDGRLYFNGFRYSIYK